MFSEKPSYLGEPSLTPNPATRTAAPASHPACSSGPKQGHRGLPATLLNPAMVGGRAGPRGAMNWACPAKYIRTSEDRVLHRRHNATFNGQILIASLSCIIFERSFEVKLPTRWTDGKAEVGRVREEKGREEKRRRKKKKEERRKKKEDQRRERVRGKKMQVRKKVEKPRFTAFFQ